MEKRQIVLPVGPDGKPVTIDLVARQSSVRPERVKCTFAAVLLKGSYFISDCGERGPEVDEDACVQLLPEFRVEVTQ